MILELLMQQLQLNDDLSWSACRCPYNAPTTYRTYELNELDWFVEQRGYAYKRSMRTLIRA